MRTGVREPWGGPLIAYLGPIDRTTQVLIARSVWAESQPVFFRFLRSPVCGSGPLTVRKLDAPELDRCWTFISRDITEPIFMLEYGSHDLMIDPGEAGDIFLVDLFDNLDWGDMWKSFMERQSRWPTVLTSIVPRSRRGKR